MRPCGLAALIAGVVLGFWRLFPAHAASTGRAPVFVDVTSAAGVASFRNVQGGDPDAKRHIIEVMGGGAAFLDYDKDGNLDILLVRGSTIERFQREKGDPVCALFRGDGRGHFADVTRQAGLGGARGWAWALSLPITTTMGGRTYTSQATGVISSFITAETVRLKT